MNRASNRSLARAALTAAVLALIAGCATPSPRVVEAGFSPEMHAPRAVVAERSIVELPAELEDARLVVRRRVENSFLHERVVLANNTATAGENAVAVKTKWRGTPFARFFTGHFVSPYTKSAIEARVEDDFGRWAEVSPPTDRVNRHGPYRYVAARADGVACVLAWQLIDAEAGVTSAVNTYALDFRMCDRERDSAALLELFDRIELKPYL